MQAHEAVRVLRQSRSCAATQGNGHNRLHQVNSGPRRPSYHVHLAFGGGGGNLDAGGGRLDRLVLGQEASSVNQAEGHRVLF